MKTPEWEWTQRYRTLIEEDQVCWPCGVRLTRIGGKRAGKATWQCPDCGKKYSDYRVHSGMGKMKHPTRGEVVADD